MRNVLFGAAILALAYLGTALALSVIAASNATKHVAELNRLVALGDSAAATLERVPLADLQPLRRACGRVPQVGFDEVLAYFPAANPERIAALPQDSLFPSQEIFGVDVERFEVVRVGYPWRADTVLDFLADLLGAAPSEWGWRGERWNEPFHHPLAGARYLVVHRLATLEPPRLIGAYEPGEMSFRSVVLDANSGAVLCAGQSVIAPKGAVSVSGSGTSPYDANAAVERNREAELSRSFAFETHFFALGEACALGGEKLCELTFRKIERDTPMR